MGCTASKIPLEPLGCPNAPVDLTVQRVADANLPVDSRDYRQCAEVLFDLGLCKVKVISNNPGKLEALEEAGLDIVERVSIQVPAQGPAAKYLQTKKEKLGHLLNVG